MAPAPRLALWSVDRHEEAREKLAACGAGDETSKSDLVRRAAWGHASLLAILDTRHSKPCGVGRGHVSLITILDTWSVVERAARAAVGHFRHSALQSG